MRGAFLLRAAFAFAILAFAACAGASAPSVPSLVRVPHHVHGHAQVDVYSETVLHDAPAAYYRLDDSGSTAADDSGNGLNGTIGGSVTEGVPGLLLTSNDTAVSLPGQASAAGTVMVPSNSLLQPASAVSLEAWLRFPSAPATFTVPVAYGSDASYAPYDFYFSSGTKLSAQFDLNTGVLVVTSPTVLQPNATYHVVSTYDGTTGRLYLNGALAASVAKSGTIVNYQSRYGLAIGDDAGLSDPPFRGTADEVAVYAGTALSATQVQSHYNAGTNPSATPPPTPTPPPPGYDWTTMGYDIARSGYNPNEKTIGIGSFGTLHKLWQIAIYGEIGEPALASSVTRGSQTVNVLYAASAVGKIYALNASSGAVLWSKQLGVSHYRCGGQRYTFGSNGAPVIDRVTNRIYVPDGAARVHAFDLATGAEQPGWPVTIATQPGHNVIYAGLTYNPANGLLYAETSSTCDISPWYGRIVAISTSTATIVGTFYPTQGQSGGGIWGFGGASVDAASNNVFILTGNADTSHGGQQNAYYAEQVIELSPDVSTVLANNYPGLPPGGDDEDFGATPLLFTPPGCPPMLAAMNKAGMFFLYNRNSIGAGPTQAVQMSITTANGDFVGVPAYDPATNLVYVEQPATFGIYRPGVAAFALRSDCTINPTPFWAAQFGADGSQSQDDTLRSPITLANGVLYISDYQTAQTFAFNAMTGTQLWTQKLSGGGIVGPIVANGKLFVGSLGPYLTAWSP
jgi:outer membrane protein assembly factor BamB